MGKTIYIHPIIPVGSIKQQSYRCLTSLSADWLLKLYLRIHQKLIVILPSIEDSASITKIVASRIEISASGPATNSHSKSSTRSAESMRDLGDRCKHIPTRLTEDERRLLSVLENTLEVCEYTDTVDVTYSHTGKSKQSRIIASLIDVLSISCGLLVCAWPLLWAFYYPFISFSPFLFTFGMIDVFRLSHSLSSFQWLLSSSDSTYWPDVANFDMPSREMWPLKSSTCSHQIFLPSPTFLSPNTLEVAIISAMLILVTTKRLIIKYHTTMFRHTHSLKQYLISILFPRLFATRSLLAKQQARKE